MRRFVVASVFVAAALGSGAPAAGDARRVALRQSATVFIAEPTLIGNTIVSGPVLFVHDDGKMARGEPCTSVRLVDPASGPTEEIAAFHCIPRRGPIVNRFTLTTRPNVSLGYGCVLIAYQFAGDPEIHGVPPTPADAH
jgi:hypothetical protein